MNSSGSSDEKETKKIIKRDITGVADLEKVTDYAEEKELSNKDISKAISIISDINLREDKQAQNEKQKELSKIVCNKEDIDLIVKEMEISRVQSEMKLKENSGNVVDTLIELTN